MDVGFGSSAYAYDWDWADGSPYNFGGGDTSNGVGHFRSKNNTGRIVYNMLASTCTTGCTNGYTSVNEPAFNLQRVHGSRRWRAHRRVPCTISASHDGVAVRDRYTR